MKEKKRTIYVRVPVEDARRIMQMLWRVGQMSFYEQISYNRFTRSLGNAQRREARLYDVKEARRIFLSGCFKRRSCSSCA